MEWESDDKELKAAGADLLGGERVGIRLRGWEIESCKRSILSSSLVQQWEEKLQTSHLPEMVFGESYLVLKHANSGIKIHFNAFDALCGWNQEALSPVEVPAAAKWKFRNKPTDQVILDYDYTFTTPYCGSTGIEMNPETGIRAPEENNRSLHWEDCQEQIDMVTLAAKEPILFYDERVMPSGWFLLLRFWLRVDGVLMRLRDTRMHCIFRDDTEPIVLQESCWREATFGALSSKGYPKDSAAYSDPGIISEWLPIVRRETQKLQ